MFWLDEKSLMTPGVFWFWTFSLSLSLFAGFKHITEEEGGGMQMLKNLYLTVL